MYIVLASAGLTVVASSLSLLAMDSPASEAEKWIGPILTSVANLFATCFAYLTSRDRLKYDASVLIKDNQLQDCKGDNERLEKEKLELENELRKLRPRCTRLVINLQAALMDKPLPYPNDTGFSHDEDPPEKK